MPTYEKVFDIPELFEAILINLPSEALLVSAQRVAKPWLELINTSLRLQGKLFFKQRPTNDRDDYLTTNPFFSKICRPFLNRHVNAYIGEFRADLACSTTPSPRFGAMFPRGQSVQTTRLDGIESWQRMFVTDTPCGVVLFMEDGGIIYNERRKIGFTMGELW